MAWHSAVLARTLFGRQDHVLQDVGLGGGQIDRLAGNRSARYGVYSSRISRAHATAPGRFHTGLFILECKPDLKRAALPLAFEALLQDHRLRVYTLLACRRRADAQP
jgi:hypothetical protein